VETEPLRFVVRAAISSKKPRMNAGRLMIPTV
jgi:hypothetical protein